MHEFSLCEGIITQVKVARPQDADKVNLVKVLIGELAGVDISSLKFWFPVVARKMDVPQLLLSVIPIVARACCNNCQHTFRLQAYYQECPSCGNYANFAIIQGKELMVDSIIL